MSGNVAPVEIIPLADVGSLMSAADTLRGLLGDEANKDIALDFPGSVQRYTGALVDVHSNLLAARDECSLGKRQQFLACIAETAIGMAMASSETAKPDVFDPDCANVSLFVCRPYRGRGIGRQLIQACLASVQHDFGGHAWTAVHQENAPSRELVLSSGFTPAGVGAGNWEGQDLYHFRAE